MLVIKRNGVSESMRFDRISDRITELSRDLDIDPAFITQKVVVGLKTGMKTSEIDNHVAETAYCLATDNPDYDSLSARIFVSNLHKQTVGSMIETFQLCLENVSSEGRSYPLVDSDMIKFANKYKTEIDSEIRYNRDYTLTYFSLRTLAHGYLLKHSATKEILERPQHLYMRVALGIHYPRLCEILNNENQPITSAELERLEKATLARSFETYHLLSLMKFTHATPTLFNSGTPFPQYSSCNLLSINDDLPHIFETLKRSALISKFAGGLGINISQVRCAGSRIASTNGVSDGIIPMIKQYDQMSRYVNQGGGKRNGAVAVFLEPWHADILGFLDLRLNDAAPDEFRARKTFLGLWVPDLFMKRVEEDGVWSLMCPNTVPGLVDSYGEVFETIYLKAESQGKIVKTIKARDLMRKICEVQINCGLPYVMFKDHVNRKSNHSNIGVIRGSNLCTEIVEYSDGDNVAVCNLASISIKAFIKSCPVSASFPIGKFFDWEELMKITRVCVVNLNRMIDYGFLGVKEAEITNKKQRAIGIGVQGFHEAMIELGMEWDSPETTDFHVRVAETIEYAATDESAELGVLEGSYHYFEESPYSQGILQCDMWGIKPRTNYDWDGLRNKCRKAMRNSMLTAYMPTATTSQIMGNTESFECASSNIYTRKVLAGEFPVVSRQLYSELSKLGLWKKEIIDRIVSQNGSVQGIIEIPEKIRRLFRTIWEYPQKVFTDLALARGPFVDQAQSLNVHMDKPTVAALSSMHMYSWKKGAKNSSYYVRSKPARDAVKFTVQSSVDGKAEKAEKVEKSESSSPTAKSPKMGYVCTEAVCTSCSS